MKFSKNEFQLLDVRQGTSKSEFHLKNQYPRVVDMDWSATVRLADVTSERRHLQSYGACGLQIPESIPEDQVLLIPFVSTPGVLKDTRTHQTPKYQIPSFMPTRSINGLPCWSIILISSIPMLVFLVVLYLCFFAELN